MKHIFISHSWVNQLLVEAVIRNCGLDKEDVIVLYNRNFFFSLDKSLILHPKRIRKIPYGTFWESLILPYRLITYYRWLNNITKGEDFALYVPHFFDFSSRLLLYSKKCKEFNLIEEGIKAHRTEEDVYKRFYKRRNIPRLFKWLEKKKFLPDIGILPLESKNVYKMSDLAFAYFPVSVNLKEDVIKSCKQTALGFTVKTLLALGAFVDGHNKMKLDVYLEKFRILLSYIRRANEGIIYYKFHPSDSPRVREETTRVFEEFGDTFVRLPDDVSAELVMIKFKPKIITFNCSLALYAVNFDCELEIATHWINKDIEVMHFEGFDLKSKYLVPA